MKFPWTKRAKPVDPNVAQRTYLHQVGNVIIIEAENQARNYLCGNCLEPLGESQFRYLLVRKKFGMRRELFKAACEHCTMELDHPAAGRCRKKGKKPTPVVEQVKYKPTPTPVVHPYQPKYNKHNVGKMSMNARPSLEHTSSEAHADMTTSFRSNPSSYASRTYDKNGINTTFIEGVTQGTIRVRRDHAKEGRLRELERKKQEQLERELEQQKLEVPTLSKKARARFSYESLGDESLEVEPPEMDVPITMAGTSFNLIREAVDPNYRMDGAPSSDHSTIGRNGRTAKKDTEMFTESYMQANASSKSKKSADTPTTRTGTPTPFSEAEKSFMNFMERNASPSSKKIADSVRNTNANNSGISDGDMSFHAYMEYNGRSSTNKNANKSADTSFNDYTKPNGHSSTNKKANKGSDAIYNAYMEDDDAYMDPEDSDDSLAIPPRLVLTRPGSSGSGQSGSSDSMRARMPTSRIPVRTGSPAQRSASQPTESGRNGLNKKPSNLGIETAASRVASRVASHAFSSASSIYSQPESDL